MQKITKYMAAVPLENRILLFNTSNGSLTAVDRGMYEQILSGEKGFSALPEGIRAGLIRLGFLVDAELDEDFRLEMNRRSACFGQDGLKHVTILPTTACNARCAYCFEQGARQASMTAETAEALTNFLDRNCTGRKLKIKWFGGEPLLGKERISQVSRALSGRGIAIASYILTNGFLFDRETVETAAKDWNLEFAQITVDGLGEEYNRVKAYVTPNDAFSRVMENIDLLLEHRIRVSIRVNYEAGKFDEKRETLEYLADRFGCRPGFRMYTHYVWPAAGADTTAPELVGREFLASKRLLWELGLLYPHQRSGRFEMGAVLKALRLAPRANKCGVVCKSNLVIGPEGELYCCQEYAGQGNAFTCGNVRDGLLENREYRRFMNYKPISGKCADCNILPLCQGGCPKNAMDYGENRCSPVKYVLDDLLIMAAEELEKHQKAQ